MSEASAAVHWLLQQAEPEARRVAKGVDERVPERFKDNYRKAARAG